MVSTVSTSIAYCSNDYIIAVIIINCTIKSNINNNINSCDKQYKINAKAVIPSHHCLQINACL